MEGGETMKMQEKICRVLLDKGKFNKDLCCLCKMNQNKCSVLNDIRNIEAQEKEFKHDETRELAREENNCEIEV